MCSQFSILLLVFWDLRGGIKPTVTSAQGLSMLKYTLAHMPKHQEKKEEKSSPSQCYSNPYRNLKGFSVTISIMLISINLTFWHWYQDPFRTQILLLTAFLHLIFCTSLLYFHSCEHVHSFFLSLVKHLYFIHHTFERVSVKNCPAVSRSARTGNELALNLAQNLNQAKVIKRNIKCDASEK